MSDPVGREIEGYRIDAEIGRGGRAVVHRATQLARQRTVALKVVTADAPTRARIVRAGATALGIDHPHVLQVYEVGEAGEDFPLQKKRHSFEFLREIAHLRPRSNTFGAVARVRNRLSFAIHEYFQSRGFLYIHTPIITTSDAEGAGELFSVSTIDPMNPPRNESGNIL